jgi:DNA-binding CsgD family transcriptional regulator
VTSIIDNEFPAHATAESSHERMSIAANASAAFLLDHSRRVMAGSARGEALILGERVLRLDPSGRLHAARSVDDGALQAALAKAVAAQGQAHPVRLLSGRSGRAWLAWIEPCSAVANYDRTVTVLMFVTPADPGPSTRAEAIMAEFRLSAAECRLVSALLAGSTLQEYARETGYSRNTVRNKLSVVFDKTGTHRQSELVALIAGRSGALARLGFGAA